MSQRDEFPVVELCEILDVSTSGYYHWREREPTDKQKEDEKLLADIEAIHDQSYGTYGRTRITSAFNDEYAGDVGHRRVGRLMREKRDSRPAADNE